MHINVDEISLRTLIRTGIIIVCIIILGFGPTEVPQVTHSSVQTTGFLNAAVSTPN